MIRREMVHYGEELFRNFFLKALRLLSRNDLFLSLSLQCVGPLTGPPYRISTGMLFLDDPDPRKLPGITMLTIRPGERQCVRLQK